MRWGPKGAWRNLQVATPSRRTGKLNAGEYCGLILVMWSDPSSYEATPYQSDKTMMMSCADLRGSQTFFASYHVLR
jgi:hypothetical protein